MVAHPPELDLKRVHCYTIETMFELILFDGRLYAAGAVAHRIARTFVVINRKRVWRTTAHKVGGYPAQLAGRGPLAYGGLFVTSGRTSFACNDAENFGH